jgi:hypothetical protein
MNIVPTLAEMFYLAFGPGWRRRAAATLGRSPRQVGRWCSGETRIPRRFLILLQRRIDAEIASFERRREKEHHRVDETAVRRRGAAFQARTWLRATLFDRPEWEPPPRGGRPRKIR